MGGDWYSIECGSIGQDGKDSPGGGKQLPIHSLK